MPLFWLLGLQSALGWSPPAQAAWAGENPPIEVRLHAPTLSMRGEAPIEVVITAKAKGFAVSPFLQPARGIAFEVVTPTGQPVTAVVPMMGSPPPPPLKAEDLVTVSPTSPYRIATRERTNTIFPKAGQFKVKARIFLFDFPSEPVRYAQLVSDTIMVNVTP
ncbi:hypothetical protein P0F65_19775 [Sphingomonas sp. I4]